MVHLPINLFYVQELKDEIVLLESWLGLSHFFQPWEMFSNDAFHFAWTMMTTMIECFPSFVEPYYEVVKPSSKVCQNRMMKQVHWIQWIAMVRNEAVS